MVLRAKVHDADVVQGRRNVGVQLTVPAPLALQDGFEQGERVKGVAVLRKNTRGEATCETRFSKSRGNSHLQTKYVH
jgi:hypothetical protein